MASPGMVPLQFRVSPELRAAVAEAAQAEDLSLNKWGVRGLRWLVSPPSLAVGDQVRPGKTSTRAGTIVAAWRMDNGLNYVTVRYSDDQRRTYNSGQRTFHELLKESNR